MGLMLSIQKPQCLQFNQQTTIDHQVRHEAANQPILVVNIKWGFALEAYSLIRKLNA